MNYFQVSTGVVGVRVKLADSFELHLLVELIDPLETGLAGFCVECGHSKSFPVKRKTLDRVGRLTERRKSGYLILAQVNAVNFNNNQFLNGLAFQINI